MPTFYLVDHSLSSYGGHHYPYAVNVLHAAEEAGLATTLAAKRTFRHSRRLPNDCRVHSLYRYSTYSRAKRFHGDVLLGGEQDEANRNISWRELIFRELQRRKQLRRTQSFQAATRKLLARQPLSKGDQVFFPTISEYDFSALAQVLREDPTTQLADWHLQFHYSFLQGREPEFAEQADRIAHMRDFLAQALAGLEGHRLHFYTTTHQLAAQYNTLQLAPFRCLAYPIDEIFTSQPRLPAPEEPIRLTCVGGIRDEKGYSNLKQLLEALWDDHFATGHTQLVVQTKRGKFRLPLPERPQQEETTLPAKKPKAAKTEPTHDHATPAIEYAPFPLDPCGVEYARLIGRADVGLFLYVSESYYARFSAALGEMLAAGAPVVVPAGCWLSEQIAEPNWLYLDSVAEYAARVAAPHRLPAQLTFGQGEEYAACELDLPAGTADFLLRYHLPAEEPAGAYRRITAHLLDSRGRTIERREVIHGRRHHEKPLAELFPVPPTARGVRLVWENAYHASSLQVLDATCDFLMPPHVGEHHPTAAVGIALADHDHVAQAVREIVQHYPHYLAEAQKLGEDFYQRHARGQTLAGLLRQANTADEPATDTRAA